MAVFQLNSEAGISNFSGKAWKVEADVILFFSPSNISYIKKTNTNNEFLVQYGVRV